MRTLLFLLLVARVEAATEYRLAVETTGDPLAQPRREVTVLVDGANWCERAGGVTQRLSNDGVPAKPIHLARRRTRSTVPPTTSIRSRWSRLRE